ncbi:MULTISPECIES: phenylalanine--tRNA ligase subunit beta [unclassified Cyanobium]|uniref:phenylalanine--tRNA ligase subunit beta n=1 Tax=unclassified Cyanobium TaxID=2627006 RepID=UPI0020CC4D45|nr:MULTISPECIES: phenylalanine--tRNA ligase subunit beta [unclassified Cyanobium]MCP9858244.1 phenylalanine--tRNA ligase subunit beta [Cyanobium sp. Cruz-8H5]MCP9865625.1 phenylalanine--tRNA ligase subunit beta [Cyanobium sp. Cruz-8D1]
MLVSLQWLRELVSVEPACLEPGHLAERLSIAGFEVEGIEDLAARAAGVVVGHVVQRDPHPNADKLSVCTVDVGNGEPLQIVCGAPNVRQGLHVPVALVGSTLPAVGLTIKPAELRGVASSGMICSLRELGLDDGSDGIAELDQLLAAVPPLGTAVGPLLGLDDQVLELAITANRPDGLSMRGIAREVAALSGGSTSFPAAAPVVAAETLSAAAADRQAIEAGGLFSLTALSGLRVGPSPDWLRQRLERAGVRPINNVVDITNLVMLETGQPLHAFDRDRLGSPTGGTPEPASIGLRQGRPGEAFVALDGQERTLSEEALVVTCADHPIALAGVMGGLGEAVTEATTAIWLEAAVFAPQAVRRSARSVGLRTEASSRFEKGVPREITLAAADRAVVLLLQLTGAQLEGRWLHQKQAIAQRPLGLRRDALHNLLGPIVEEGEERDLDDGRISVTLEALGCVLEEDEEGWQVRVPPERAMDLKREVDLIEEVARLVGYDHFAAHLPDPLLPGGLEPAQQLERRLRRALCAAGLQEVVSLSLVSAATDRVPLANPLLADYGHLRDNLHQELLQAARRNLQASLPGFWGFEIGRVFPGGAARGEECHAERTLLVGVIAGERRSERWRSSGKPTPPDYFQARGVLQAGLEPLRLPVEDRPLSDAPLLHPGRAAQLVVEGRSAGWFGQLHPAEAEALDLPSATYVFQLELEPLLSAGTRRNRWQPAFRPFATVPASERDLALVVPTDTSAAALLAAIRKAGKPLLEQAELVDRYEGAQLEAGRCSQAFRLRYRDSARTLTDEEVEAAHGRVREALERQFGAQQRR